MLSWLGTGKRPPSAKVWKRSDRQPVDLSLAGFHHMLQGVKKISLFFLDFKTLQKRKVLICLITRGNLSNDTNESLLFTKHPQQHILRNSILTPPPACVCQSEVIHRVSALER